MPRETVHTDMRPYGPEIPAVSAVEVTWARDSAHVQLGTVLLNADDGLPFRPARMQVVNQNGMMVTAGGDWYGTWGGWYPTGVPYETGDPLPVPTVTIPMVPVDTLVPDDAKATWCEDCRAGRHQQCADDTSPHDGPDKDDWCRCPCGEIKQQLLDDEQLAQVDAGPAGHYVQLNRRELNELIRKLKRAGAQAFGHDEW